MSTNNASAGTAERAQNVALPLARFRGRCLRVAQARSRLGLIDLVKSRGVRWLLLDFEAVHGGRKR